MLSFKRNALLGNISGQPLCADYKSAWRRCGEDKEMLVRLVMKQQSIPFFVTACNKNLGLSKDYIKQEFSEYINGHTLMDCDDVAGYRYGLYVDWDYENDIDVSTDVCSIMWTVGANVVVPQTKCPTIYISNHSNVHIVGDGFNNINIKLFDKSIVTIEDLDNESEVIVYKYSDDAKVEIGEYCFGNVKEFNKKLKL